MIGIVSFRFCAVIPEPELDPEIDLRVAAGIGFASTSPGVRGFTAENKIFNRNIDTTDKERVIYIWCNQAVKKINWTTSGS